MSLIRKRKQIVAWLDKNLISNYTIIKDKQYGHIVNVDGNVSLSYKKLKKIPFKFNKINGNFDCSNNSLICLQGAPDIINGSFYCSYNHLQNLEYAPSYVEKAFYCNHNNIENISLNNNEIGHTFIANNNKIKCLNLDNLPRFLPETVVDSIKIDFSHNLLDSQYNVTNYEKLIIALEKDKLNSLFNQVEEKNVISFILIEKSFKI